jgi:hypothetical protein
MTARLAAALALALMGCGAQTTQVSEFHPWWMDPHPEIKCTADPPLREILDTGRGATVTCVRRSALEIVVSPLGQGDLWQRADPYALT